jgi:hypothetical protein
MPARDRYHQYVRTALENDGWTITHDPLRIPFGKRDLFVDLGAERLLAAEREDRKIAVEVKSFIGPSETRNLEQTLGQYVLYRGLFSRFDPERVLYVAITRSTYNSLFSEDVGEVVIHAARLRLIIVADEREEVEEWIDWHDTEQL